MQVKIGWLGMTDLQSHCRVAFSVQCFSVQCNKSCSEASCCCLSYGRWQFVSPMKQVAYQTCARTTTSRSLLVMCFYTYLVLGIGWGDSWCIAKHASGLRSENTLTGFWMRLLSWIMGSLIVTTPLHCNSCFWHQGNGSVSTTWKRKPLQPIPYWFVKLTRFYKWN